MRTLWIIISIFLFCALAGCHQKPKTRVTVRIQSGHGQKIYLSPIPYIKEKGGAIDSAIVEDMTREIVFSISGPEHLYQLTFAHSGVRFVFINDVPELSIAGNFLTSKYEVHYSPASTGLHRFLEAQAKLAGRTRRLAQLIEKEKSDSLRDDFRQSPSLRRSDSLRRSLDSTFTALGTRYRDYADTVKSPSAFMAVYNLIEFGRDYDGQARFITAAAIRFPSSHAIRELQEDVLAYVQVMKEEFQPGEKLPSITLPDAEGRAFSTGSLKGKYYLIDFWSTWCPQCSAYRKAEINIRKLFPAGRFEMVSVAIDAEKKDWENILRVQQPGWPQLIDTEMWQGAAVRTLKFDSIPFNFLVDPEGRILQKGIPPDSLAEAVARALAR
jgi:thiol-disulfide isomerase/thioredoxin